MELSGRESEVLNLPPDAGFWRDMLALKKALAS
jgi:hypothetical protein